MPNTAPRDFEHAVKHYAPWKSLWARTDEQADEAHLDPEDLREAYGQAWHMGHAEGERAGYRQAEAEGGNYEGERYV